MKNTKKFFGILFAIIALTLVMSLSIFAEETTSTPTTYEVATLNEYNTAYASAVAGDTIKLTANISADYLQIEKQITLDLGGYTLTTKSGYSGVRMKNGCSLINGTLNHSGRTCAIKAWNVGRFEDLVIICSYDGSAGPKTIGGIVLQESSTVRIESIKNVTLTGQALQNGIETYNCGNATNDVIGSMENVTIDARGTGMLLSAPIGTVTGCTISGDVTGVSAKAQDSTWNTSVSFENCTIEGGSQAMYINGNSTGGAITISADKNTTFESEVGQTIVVDDTNPESLDLDEVVGLTNNNGVWTDCAHTSLSVQGSCTVKAECADCTRVLGYVHSYGEPVRVASTCSVAGSVTYTCSCGATDTNKLPYDAAAHNYTTAVTAPTCTEQGYTTYTCQYNICSNKTKTDDYVDALGHDMVTDAEAVEPSCTGTGLTSAVHCSRCDTQTTTQQEVPATGHDIEVLTAVPSTCLTTGLTEGQRCKKGCADAVVEQEEVAALGHDIVISEAVAASCTKTGLTEGQHCTRCYDATVTQKTVDALGHDIITDKEAVAPTCTETGLTAGTRCSRCDKATVAQQTVSALGHSWLDATTEAPKTCSVCSVTEGEKLPPVTTDTTPNEDEDKGLSGGAIAGIVAGSVVVLGGGGFAAWWFIFRKKFI